MRPKTKIRGSGPTNNNQIEQILSEFAMSLIKRKRGREELIRRFVHYARHFLIWMDQNGYLLKVIDDTTLRCFRDHDCGCVVRMLRHPWNRQTRLTLREHLKGLHDFIRFLESTGRTEHPGELQLGNQILEQFLGELEASGYSHNTVRSYKNTSEHFLVWLHGSRIPIRAITPDTLDKFLAHDCVCPRPYEKPRKVSPKRMSEILHILRKVTEFFEDRGLAQGHRSGSKPRKYANLTEFRRWLKQNRGIRASTIEHHERSVHSLLQDLGTDPSQYNAALIREVLLHHFERSSHHKSKQLACSLRMYLRYLASRGDCSPRLIRTITTSPWRRLSTLPRYIPIEDVERLIASCDTERFVGMRDKAILLLLARLGLRAGDVHQLRFTNIDWKNARLYVHGKSKQPAALPLPQDVGDALLEYICKARPRVNTDIVFLRAKAPNRPFADSSAVSNVVESALKRAGVDSPGGRGAHLIRHSFATHLLRSGASMEFIGAMLRHESAETTAIYAKVNVPMLQEIAQPWIGGAR